MGNAEKQMVTARIDADAIKQIKSMEIPVSKVVEAGINYFLSLEEVEQKLWILQNTTELGRLNVNDEELVEIRKTIAPVSWKVLSGPATGNSINSALPIIARMIPMGGVVIASVIEAMLSSKAKSGK